MTARDSGEHGGGPGSPRASPRRPIGRRRARSRHCWLRPQGCQAPLFLLGVEGQETLAQALRLGDINGVASPELEGPGKPGGLEGERATHLVKDGLFRQLPDLVEASTRTHPWKNPKTHGLPLGRGVGLWGTTKEQRMGRSEAAAEGTKKPSTEGAGLTMAEASKLVGKAESTVRAWVRTQQVNAWQDTAGWWRIDRNSLLSHAASAATAKGNDRGAGTRQGAQSDLTSYPQPTPSERILTEALERERRLNDELRARLSVMENERTQHMAEMRAMLSKDGSGGKDGVLSRWIRR